MAAKLKQLEQELAKLKLQNAAVQGPRRRRPRRRAVTPSVQAGKALTQGVITLRRRDYLGDIKSVISMYKLKPADFSFLKRFAGLFERYIWKKVIFHYVPSVGTTVAGSFAMAVDWEVHEKAINFSDLFARTPCVSGPVWAAKSMVLPPGRIMAQRAYDMDGEPPASVLACVSGSGTGQLWCEYEIVLEGTRLSFTSPSPGPTPTPFDQVKVYDLVDTRSLTFPMMLTTAFTFNEPKGDRTSNAGQWKIGAAEHKPQGWQVIDSSLADAEIVPLKTGKQFDLPYAKISTADIDYSIDAGFDPPDGIQYPNSTKTVVTLALPVTFMPAQGSLVELRLNMMVGTASFIQHTAQPTLIFNVGNLLRNAVQLSSHVMSTANSGRDYGFMFETVFKGLLADFHQDTKELFLFVDISLNFSPQDLKAFPRSIFYVDFMGFATLYWLNTKLVPNLVSGVVEAPEKPPRHLGFKLSSAP